VTTTPEYPEPLRLLVVAIEPRPGNDHVPPAPGLLKVVLAPTHSVVAPAMGDRPLTVIVAVRVQPEALANVTTAVPADTPETTPFVEPMPAALAVELHVPPGVLLSVIVAPAQTADGPVMDGGDWLTVTTVVVKQLPPNEYVTVAVPLAIPVIIPVVDPIEAVPLLVSVHVPPVAGLLSVAVVPVHTMPGPVITDGDELTVTVAVARQPVSNV
jgi:hypothetical protein